MILFAEDWLKYPTAKPNWETKNKSYVELAKLYKYMGIQNHAFHLALINPQLKDVDPFSENLALETMAAIALECKINPWYYFREIARVPGGSGEDAVPLRANRGNIALFWSFFNHITTFLIQIRQTGKSVSVDELATYLLNVRCRGTDINLLTKDETLRVNNIKRLKEIDSELPFYLKQRTKNDANNTEMITVNALKNRYVTHLPQASPKLANNVGRGLTSPITIVDEGPFQPNIEIAVPAAFAAGTDARERAARAGEPYGNIFTTTAGKKDEKGGKYIYDILCDSAEWTEKFFDAKNHADLERIVRACAPGKKFYVNITLNHRQLGKDDDWLRRAIENTPGITPDQADRDFFNRWTSGSQTNPLSIEDLERIRNSQSEPAFVSIAAKGGYVTRWFIPENCIAERLANGKYLFTMDTSEAAGNDDISLRLIDVKNGETIAAGTYNETNLITFAEWVTEEWFIRYPNIVGVIERRSTGSTLLDHLLLILPSKGIDPFKRLFNRVVNDYDEEPERFKEIQLPMGRRSQDVYVKYKKHFGFATSGSGITSRSELYSSVLHSAAKQIGDKVKDKKTIDQITALIVKNGRVDHPAGEHDDMVIAWLLGHWFMTKAKNLSFYDLPQGYVLSQVKQKQMETPAETYHNRLQLQYREKLKEVLERLNGESDYFITQKLEQEARHLSTLIETQESETLSVDDLIRNMREERKRNKPAGAVGGIYNRQNSGGFYDRYHNPNLLAQQHRDPTQFNLNDFV